MLLLTIEGLPHPGKDIIFKCVMAKLRSKVPIVYHQCVHSERVSSAAYPAFLTSLRNLDHLRSLQHSPCVMIGKSSYDGSHVPAVARVHAEVYAEVLKLSGDIAHRKTVVVHLKCETHDCFDRMCASCPNSMTLDEIGTCKDDILEMTTHASDVLEIQCPAFFDDNELFIEHTVKHICSYFEMHIKKIKIECTMTT